MNSKKILILGTGWEQEELVREAKNMNLEIIASHPALNNDGFRCQTDISLEMPVTFNLI